MPAATHRRFAVQTDASRCRNLLISSAMRKAVNCGAKDRVSCGKTWSFALRFAVFRGSPGVMADTMARARARPSHYPTTPKPHGPETAWPHVPITLLY